VCFKEVRTFNKKTMTKTILTLLMSMLFALQLTAQEVKVFHLRFTVDEVLIDQIKKETTTDRVFLTGMSERVELSEDLLDSVRTVTNFLLEEKTGGNSSMLYRKDKKGREIKTFAMEIFPGMPIGTLKQAMGAEKADKYVKIEGRITPQAKVASSTANPSRSKVRPQVELRVWIYGSDGSQEYSKRVMLRDFEVLRSKSRVRRTVRTTVSEVLSPERIVEMYQLSLEEALFGK